MVERWDDHLDPVVSDDFQVSQKVLLHRWEPCRDFSCRLLRGTVDQPVERKRVGRGSGERRRELPPGQLHGPFSLTEIQIGSRPGSGADSLKALAP